MGSHGQHLLDGVIDTPAPCTGTLRVRPLDLADGRQVAAWDRFVETAPGATFFHRSGWKRVIERVFGHDCPFLMAEDATGIRGVLPLTHLASRLFGRTLVSTAFCVYGGPVATDAAALAALDEAALDMARSLGVGMLEYRQITRQHAEWTCEDTLYATFRRTIAEDPEANLKAIPRKQRAVVRKALDLDLAVSVDDDVDTLHAVYAESVRNLGTPVFPRAWFRALRDEFAGACDVVTVRHQGRPVSSVLNFYFRDQVLPYYGGGTPDARACCANDMMYWEVMRRAGLKGLKVFDFGRSKHGTGAFAFKKNWGFTPEPLHYEYQLFGRDERPAVTPSNPKYRLFIAAWKRLPLPVANAVGPWIARDLG